MITKRLIGLLTVLTILAFGCGNATERGGDDTASTTDTTTESASENVTMKEESVPMEEEGTEAEAVDKQEGATTSESEPQAAEEEKEMAPATPPKPSYQRIAYREGTTSQVSGSIQGTNTQQYISALPAKALTFTLLTDNPAARLMITDTGGKRLSRAGQEVTYTAPSQNDYLIKVFMNMGNEASSQKADYRLQIRAAE